MKSLKKIIAMMAVAAMTVSTVVTASASFSGITVEPSTTKLAGGESVTIVATFDTLVNAKGMEIEFAYDDDSFSIDTTNNEDYNFGTNKKPVYYPNYVIEDVLSNYMDEMSIYNAWGSLSYNNYDNGVKFLSTDTDSGYIIEEGDEADDMYPYKSVGVIFTANDDIADGEYVFTIKAIVSDATAGDIVDTKTVTVKVGEDEPTPDPEPADPSRTAITESFTATTTTYVEVELVGKDTNSYALPSGVKNGEAIVAGILKYTVGVAGVNGTVPEVGDTFYVKVKNLGSEDAKIILTEEVK